MVVFVQNISYQVIIKIILKKRKNNFFTMNYIQQDRPAELCDVNNPDWVPSQHLGYEIEVTVKRKSSLECHKRVLKRVSKQKSVRMIDVNKQ